MSARPNILLIFTDQQRFDTIGALGNPFIRTPNLDRLVHEGTAFTSAYTPSPECVPARCCLTFGQYPSSTGCFSNRDPFPFAEKQTLFDALTESGYRTHGIGKCHFSPGEVTYEPHGFQSRETQEELSGMTEKDDYLQYLWANGFRHVTDPNGIRGDMYYMPQPAQMPAIHHPTQWVGDRAVSFIQDRRGDDQPWFLYSGIIHPHPPFCPPNPWHKLYRDLDVPPPHLPPGYESLQIHINRIQNRYKRFDRGSDLWRIRMMRAYYFACISFIDYQVGRMLEALETTGQLENTLIAFSSDHGELLGDFGSVGKRSYHDAASRVPMILRHPGCLPAGATCDTPVSLIDLTRTFSDLAQAPLKTHQLEGENLVDLAAAPPADRTIFTHLNNRNDGIYAAINRRWKFAYSAPDQAEFLLDRRRDPLETKNLTGISLPPDWPSTRVADSLRDTLQTHLRQGGQSDAVDARGWVPYPRKSLPANPDSGLIYQDHPWADQSIPGYTD
ncbi:MAG: sulfatase-like hydrolase/transferase [Opitutaceae bacterium]